MAPGNVSGPTPISVAAAKALHPSSQSAKGGAYTSADLISKLETLFDRLEEAHDLSIQRAYEFADAVLAYEVSHASARITAEAGEGTAGFKDSTARNASAEKKRAMKLAEEIRRSARDAEENIRAQLSALQTIAAAVRSEIEMGKR